MNLDDLLSGDPNQPLLLTLDNNGVEDFRDIDREFFSALTPLPGQNQQMTFPPPDGTALATSMDGALRTPLGVSTPAGLSYMNWPQVADGTAGREPNPIQRLASFSLISPAMLPTTSTTAAPVPQVPASINPTSLVAPPPSSRLKGSKKRRSRKQRQSADGVSGSETDSTSSDQLLLPRQVVERATGRKGKGDNVRKRAKTSSTPSTASNGQDDPSEQALSGHNDGDNKEADDDQNDSDDGNGGNDGENAKHGKPLTEQERLKIKREKNKLAARRSRKKKLDKIAELEEAVKKQERINSEIKTKQLRLRKAVGDLRASLETHTCNLPQQ